MFKVTAFKDINLVLGVLKGSLAKDDLNTFGNDVVRNVEQKLMPDFTFMMDVTKFESKWCDGDSEIDEKMEEIKTFIKLMGLKEIFIVGANHKIYSAHKEATKSKEKGERVIFFANMDEALDYVKRNKES